MKDKYCPLVDHDFCINELCAWWTDGTWGCGCAVKIIAQNTINPISTVEVISEKRKGTNKS